MKKRIMLLIFLSVLLGTGCGKDDQTVTTGIIGTVEYGEGDCMPVTDPVTREYEPYTGKIYFVVKEDWDNQADDNYEQLKSNSIRVNVKQGKLVTELPVGTYLVMPENLNAYSDENTITIESETVVKKDFSFFKCTSF